jgi:hypothetical protein
MDDLATKLNTSARPQGPMWLTYVELGERLGVTPDAARQKAIRGRYRKQRGNDGKARVLVEPEILLAAVQTQPPADHPDIQVDERMDAAPPVQTPETSHPSATETALVALLEDQISFLKALVENERTRADRLQDELLSLAKTHTTTLERHSDEMRRMALEAEKARSDLVEWKARPWWRRLAG